MDDNREQEGQMHSRPASILRVSGSYRTNQITNHPSITINLPTDTPAGLDASSDASDAQAQQQRRQRREEFEQLRREHYHNMFATVHGDRIPRRQSTTVPKASSGRTSSTGPQKSTAEKDLNHNRESSQKKDQT